MTTDQFTTALPITDSGGGCGAGCGCSTAVESGDDVRAALLGAQRPGDDAPIACTLSAAGMEAQLAAWRDLLTGVTEREPLDEGLRLTFGPGTDPAAVATLAAAEHGCCAFLRFALTINARGLALEVRTREDTQEVLVALFGADS
jgi:hypothetical protein